MKVLTKDFSKIVEGPRNVPAPLRMKLYFGGINLLCFIGLAVAVSIKSTVDIKYPEIPDVLTAFVLCAAFSGGFVAFNAYSKRNYSRLLTEGRFALAKLVEVEKSQIDIHTTPSFLLKYVFMVGANVYTSKTSVFIVTQMGNSPVEPVLYDIEDPNNNILINSSIFDVYLDEEGQITCDKPFTGYFDLAACCILIIYVVYVLTYGLPGWLVW